MGTPQAGGPRPVAEWNQAELVVALAIEQRPRRYTSSQKELPLRKSAIGGMGLVP